MCNGNMVETGGSKINVPIKRRNIETSDRGRGVSIMGRENTQNQTKQKFNDKNLQILTLESNCKTKLYLTCVYIPPSAVINQNLTKLQKFP